MSPPTGGEARVGLPVTAPADAQPGDQIQVQLTYKTEAVSVLKRAELTECTLTMYLGPTLIYQNKIWTTDGSYTTVTSMPAGPSSVTTLVIVQFCPTTSVPIVIRDVSVSVVAASSASSNAAQSTTNISTGTAVPVVPAPVATPTGGTSSSDVPTPTSVPSTTAAPEPPSTPFSQVPLYRAQAYTTGACSRSGSGNCVLSGAPVATSGLLAAATPVPVLNPGNPTQAYELCARMCQNTIGCNSWALDRTLSENAPEWKCYFYSGVVSSYAVSPNRAYNDIVWFSKDCYGCMQQAQVLYIADQAAVPSSSSSSTPSDAAAVVVPTTRAPEPAASSTKSVRPGITPPPDVPTLEMPTTVTETSCPLPTVGQWYTAGCTLSGAPLQTSGLVAIATGIPATPSGAVTNAPFEHAYQACAQMCAAITTCRSWALDRGMWPNDYSDWTCYFYSAGARVMAPQNQGNSWVVWMDSMCYNCGTPTPSPALPSSTSSNAPPLSAATVIPTTTPVIPATSAPAPTTISPPQEPSAFAAPTYTSGVCATKSNPANQAPCAISGWPTPASMSGLVAVATGVPPNPSGSFNFEQPFQVCARACAAIDGCTVWAVDRGNWPTDMSTWSCLLYNFNGRNYLLNTSPNAASSRYAWSDSNCYNCTLSQQAVSSYASSSSGSLPTSSTVPVSPFYTPSSGPLTTTSAPVAAITTFSAPPLVTSCNRPTAAQWYTNGCTMSGVATATTSLLAVATGIAPNAAGDFNFEPAYQRCASICAGIAGCQGYALDRTNTTSWNCNFHNMAIQPYLSRQQFTVDNRGVVWMSMLCYDCPVPGPWPPVAPSSSSVAAAVPTTLLPSETATAALPSVTPSTSTSTSTSTAISIQGYSQTTSPASASTSASAIPSSCTRAVSPPASAACNVKGFRQPAGQAAETHVYTQADCAAYCLTTGAAVCKSYAWIPATGWCGVYSLDVWTAIGDDAVAGRAYRDYVLDEPGCFACPEGVAVKYLPS